jgi:YidC/Oxa1 family membrane protein insertase
MPIFLVLFQVVRGLTRRVSSVGLATGERSFSESGQIVEFAQRTFNPNYLSENSALYQDLTHDTEMRSFGLDLSESASQALGEGILHGLPYLLLVIAVGVTTWLQQKQIAGRQTGAEVNPQQQMIMKVLPFMLPIFSFGFPAALVVYWFVSNLFRVGQQVFITKQVYGKDGGDAVVVPAATESKNKSTKSNANQTARKGSSKTSGGKHGSRSPVSGPAPKKKPKPKAQSASAKKRSTPESKQRQERTTSKRVTPKKASAPEPTTSTRRRDRKKK